MSLSRMPPVPRAPGSVPPCAGSSTTMLRPPCCVCPLNGEAADPGIPPCGEAAGGFAGAGVPGAVCWVCDGAGDEKTIAAPVKTTESAPNSERSLIRTMFPTSCSISNLSVKPRGAKQATAAKKGRPQRCPLMLNRIYSARNLVRRGRFSDGYRRHVRFFEHSIDACKIFSLKRAPARQRVHCGLFPFLACGCGIRCRRGVGALHDKQQPIQRRRNFGKRFMVFAWSSESKQHELGVAVRLHRRFHLFTQPLQSRQQLAVAMRVLLARFNLLSEVAYLLQRRRDFTQSRCQLPCQLKLPNQRALSCLPSRLHLDCQRLFAALSVAAELHNVVSRHGQRTGLSAERGANAPLRRVLQVPDDPVHARLR